MDSRGQQGPADASVGPDVGGSFEAAPTVDGGAPGRRRSRTALWTALGAVVAAAVAVVVLRDGPPSPEEDLARVRAFVEAARTARFEGASRSEYGSGPDEPGSTSIDVTRIEGSFALPDRVHVLDDAGGYLFESIAVPGGSYHRSAESRDELRDERWTYEPPAEDDADAMATGIAIGEFGPGSAEALSAAGGVLGAFGAPFDLVEVLGRLDTVRRVSPGVLEASLPLRRFLPAELVEAVEREAAELAAEHEADPEEDEDWVASADDILDGTVTVRLTHSTDARLDQLELRTDTGEGDDRSSDSTALRFSAWGEAVAVEAPDAASVDPTPGVDEEDLVAFRAFPVLAPASPPAGMVLEYATVTEEDAEEETCASVDLSYGTRGAGGETEDETLPSAFLRLTLLSTTCPWAEETASFFGDTGAATPVQVGPHRAELRDLRFPSDEPGEGMVNLRFTVGGVIVSADSDLPPDQLIATMAAVGPLDLAAQPVERAEPPPAR